MAKRILVPLDGSPEAQALLPLVAALARGSGGEVRLLRVAPVPTLVADGRGRVVAYADQEMARIESEARESLRAFEAGLDGIPAEAVVRFGDPGEEILREAEAFDADLVALATARRGWLAQLGGVAGRVFRKAGVPVFLLGAR